MTFYVVNLSSNDPGVADKETICTTLMNTMAFVLLVEVLKMRDAKTVALVGT